MMRNTLPPLASNDLFGCGSVDRAASCQEHLFQRVEFAVWVKQNLYSVVHHPLGSGVDRNVSPRRCSNVIFDFQSRAIESANRFYHAPSFILRTFDLTKY